MFRPISSISRYVSLVAVFAALYSVYGYISGIALRSATRSLDLFFLLPVFFAILFALTGRRWSATLLGTVIGLLFLYPTAGVPLSPHITISLIVNGLVFDLYLRESKASAYQLSQRQLVTAATLGNLAMAVSGLLLFQLFIAAEATEIWAIALVGDTVAGALGGFFGSIIVDRVQGIQSRKVLTASSSVRVKA
jgi:hypothetical protein